MVGNVSNGDAVKRRRHLSAEEKYQIFTVYHEAIRVTETSFKIRQFFFSNCSNLNEVSHTSNKGEISSKIKQSLLALHYVAPSKPLVQLFCGPI